MRGNSILWLGLALALSACASPRTSDEARGRAVRFLAGAYDGRQFCDPYLRFRYPGEPLSFPDRRIVLTHRHLDAYILATLLRQRGLAETSLGLLGRDAQEVLRTLRVHWADIGVHDVRRNSSPVGVGLDTYAIVAYLTRDEGLTRRLANFSDGEGWVDPRYYRGVERFRRLADDSWALRALGATNVAPGLLESSTRAFLSGCRELLRQGLAPQEEANLLVHVLEAESELRDSSLSEETRAAFGRLASEAVSRTRALMAESTLAHSPLDAANLGLALLPHVGREDAVIAEARATVLQQQAADGSWRFDPTTSSSDGVVFATLRCLLFLMEAA